MNVHRSTFIHVVLQVHLFLQLGHLAIELLPLFLHHLIAVWVLNEEVPRVSRATEGGLIRLFGGVHSFQVVLLI